MTIDLWKEFYTSNEFVSLSLHYLTHSWALKKKKNKKREKTEKTSNDLLSTFQKNNLN